MFFTRENYFNVTTTINCLSHRLGRGSLHSLARGPSFRQGGRRPSGLGADGQPGPPGPPGPPNYGSMQRERSTTPTPR